MSSNRIIVMSKSACGLAKGYGSFQSAWRTLQGIEAINRIRKGRVRWLSKGDALGLAFFFAGLFGFRRSLAAPLKSAQRSQCAPPPASEKFAMKPRRERQSF